MTRDPAPPILSSSAMAAVQVPLPDLGRFDQLLGGGADQRASDVETKERTRSDMYAADSVGVFFA
jgi:hypothetical protein